MQVKIRWKSGVLAVSGVVFDPKLTLMDSAQCFLWREHEARHYTVLNDSPLCLESSADGFRLYPVNELQVDDYIHYFDLARDYAEVRARYAEVPVIAQAMDLLPGLRTLNQPAWEVLICFILSANNNVERIRKLTWLLCEHYGEQRELDGLTLRTMPSPAVLAAVPEAELRALGVGYRAPYLIKTAEMVRDGFDLDVLQDMPCDDAVAALTQLSGVGEKVANCVLLFGCGHADAFPVDVWVARLMHSWFPQFDGLSNKKLARASRAWLGDEVGIAQQFLFHCARCGLIALDDDEGR